MNIIDFIPFGRENAISMEELAHRIGRDKRTARNYVFTARRRGNVICSTCCGNGSDGYYLPVSVKEVIPYVRMQQSRIESAKLALKSAEDYINNKAQGSQDGDIQRGRYIE